MKLSFERQFQLAGHALAAVGVAALATTHQVGVGYVAAAIASLVWSFAGEWRSRKLYVPAPLANTAMIALLAVIAAPVVTAGASPVRAVAEFLLVLVSLKFVAVKENRDWTQIYLLSFFQLVAASALTVEAVFALVFLAYLVLAPCVLVLFLLRREVAEAGRARRLVEEAFVEPSLFRSLAGMTVVLFVSTLVIFILFPRMGAGYFASPFGGVQALTGFSEELGLGKVAALQEDDAVAMRVVVDPPELLKNQIYWRGVALDRFDGRHWTRRPRGLQRFARGAPGTFLSADPWPRGAFVKQEIILEPQESPALFFAGDPREVRGPFADVSNDRLGNLVVLRATGIRVRYNVTSTLAPRRTPPTPGMTSVRAIDSRIVDLARRETGASSDDRTRAGALLSYLRRGFRYTLTPGDPGQEDPLVRFLFDSKSGHCEYFASAYAVMLRAVGIPAVVVNGYAGGEWNSYGGYYIVRQRDAHSWVEAYIDGEWLTFDPTPAGDPRQASFATRFGEMMDAAQVRWYRYVVNYTLEDQAETAISLRSALRDLWSRLWTGGSDTDEEPESVDEQSPGGMRWTWIGGAILLALAAWLWRRRRSAQSDDASLPEAGRQYARLLRSLEPLGLGKRPGETATEFCERIAPRLNGQAEQLSRLTSLYEEARFSGLEAKNGSLRREVDSMIATLSDVPR